MALTGDRRGRYDRALTRAQRAERQRQRILDAAVVALDEVGGPALTVDQVLVRARVGRNTLYAHFDGVPDLLGAVREHALDLLLAHVDASTAECRTPLERLRAMADGWLEAVRGAPALARAGLSHVVGADPRQLGSGAVPRLVDRLGDVLLAARRDGLMSRPPSALTLQAVAGAFVAVALGCVDERRPVSASEASRALVDLTVRSLR